jgi:N-acetylglucosamine-6-sulfatase
MSVQRIDIMYRNITDISQNDPHQLDNLMLGNKSQILLGRPLSEVTSRLDALLMVQKSCKRTACQKPWTELHPAGDAASLSDALDSRFDGFYAKAAKVGFSRCDMGYLVNAEGPQFGTLGMRYDTA